MSAPAHPSKRGRSVNVRRRPRPVPVPETAEFTADMVEQLDERLAHPETSPELCGGDVDADWQRAEASGEETVGGSVATPDQDIVDELGAALGVEQEPDAEVRMSEEILRGRDRHYWHLERRQAEKEERAARAR